MKRPERTIGMAHFQDFHGAYFTLQSLRLNNPEYMETTEFVIVDNSPGSAHSNDLKNLVAKMQHNTAGVVWVEMTNPQGTSPSRNRIFDEASGEYVLAMDCHVILPPGALFTLDEYYRENPECKDIISGPLLYDSLKKDELASHYGNVWRAEMWGIWESAWISDDGEGPIFAMHQTEDGRCYPVSVDMARTPLDLFGDEQIPWAGHDKILHERGFHKIGEWEEDKPFEIPGQGLGLFSCRLDAWQGFHPNANGFGGEELWIHEKFRKAGGKAICIPQLGWVHRFGRPEGVKYPLTRWKKVRNYVLEFQQIGLDLQPIFDHFVLGGFISRNEWESLLTDPIGLEDQPVFPVQKKEPGCNTCGSGKSEEEKQAEHRKMMDGFPTVQELFNLCKAVPRDMDQHLETLQSFAGKCEHVTEISNRRESTIALLNAAPKEFWSYNSERDWITERAQELNAATNATRFVLGSSGNSQQIPTIEETDMLFIDSVHTGHRLLEELLKYGPYVRRFIAMHDTAIYGETGEDGQAPGLLPAVAEFLNRNPEWSVIFETEAQYGLLIIGRLDEDKPPLPSFITMAGNLATALKDFASDGFKMVPKDVFEHRLNICNMCPQRRDNRCAACGCFVEKKASMRVSECPMKKWPAVAEEQPASGGPENPAG